ncbi:hypothetical protein A5725_19135 [Mycobacterium kubicae]|nr:hypothetical protein A5725_19135 [Mycobacterium kubicae]
MAVQRLNDARRSGCQQEHAMIMTVNHVAPPRISRTSAARTALRRVTEQFRAALNMSADERANAYVTRMPVSVLGA